MSRTIIEERGVRLEVEAIQPIEDQVLLRGYRNDQSQGGLYLPYGEATECFIGEVLALGPGGVVTETGERCPIKLARGERVIVMKYAGGPLRLKGVDYKIIREHGVWAKIKAEIAGERVEIMEVEPYSDHILVKLKNEGRTRGGLYLATKPQTKYAVAQVVRVGLGKRDMKTGHTPAMELSPGQDILMLRYSGAVVKVLGVEYRLIEPADVIALVEEE